MLEIPLNIIEFIEQQALLNDGCLSAWQRTILKSTYGLPLSAAELEIYQRGTGQEKYSGIEQQEVTIIAGRRGGKTSKIACTIAVFEAFRCHCLPHGEMGYVVLLAPTIKQARIAFRYIYKYIVDSPVLRKRVVKKSKNEIELDNGITIGCYPCSYVAVRGITIVAAICDEMAFWRHDETFANPEQEILDALRPGMATVKRPKLIKISTPFRKEGILWSEFQRRRELDFPVWQAPTSEMNPTVSSAKLEREQQRDDRKFRREYLAEFSEDVTSWIDPEILESCVMRDRKRLPRLSENLYVAAIDPGFKHSDFALAIAHRSPEGVIVLDCLDRWRGTKKQPVVLEWVCRQIKEGLDEFGINSVISDQYYAEAVKQELLEFGIFCEVTAFGANTRAQIFGNLRHLLEQGKIELPDDPELLAQLRSLEELKTARGLIDVRASGRMRDDLAVVVALAARELTRRPFDVRILAPQLGIVERPRAFGIPGSCEREAICKNFPRCLDERSCQGFEDERVNV